MTDRRWPLQVFYDGDCPLCAREVKHYMAKDVYGRIEWVSIAGERFDAKAYGLDPQRVNAVMHARTADGRVFTELWAFVRIWEALPLGLLTTPLKWMFKVPGVIWLVRPLYLLFAKNRHRLTGRCKTEGCEL